MSFQVGGVIKVTLRDLMLFNTEYPINSLDDVVSLLDRNTSYQVVKFTPEDIRKEKESLPAKFKSLTGANVIHELVYTPDWVVKAKKLPTDAKYFTVNTNASFVPGVSMAVRLAPPQVAVHEVADNPTVMEEEQE